MIWRPRGWSRVVQRCCMTLALLLVHNGFASGALIFRADIIVASLVVVTKFTLADRHAFLNFLKVRRGPDVPLEKPGWQMVSAG